MTSRKWFSLLASCAALAACGSSGTNSASADDDGSGEKEPGGEGPSDDPDVNDNRYDDGDDRDDGALWDHEAAFEKRRLLDFSVSYWRVIDHQLVAAIGGTRFEIYDYAAMKVIARTEAAPEDRGFFGNRDAVVVATKVPGASVMWTRAAGKFRALDACTFNTGDGSIVTSPDGRRSLIVSGTMANSNHDDSHHLDGELCLVDNETLAGRPIDGPNGFTVLGCQPGAAHDFVCFGRVGEEGVVGTIDDGVFTVRAKVPSAPQSTIRAVETVGPYLFFRTPSAIYRAPRDLSQAPNKFADAKFFFPLRGGKVVVHGADHGMLEVSNPDGSDRVRLSDKAFVPEFMLSATTDTRRLRMVPFCTPEGSATSGQGVSARDLRIYDLKSKKTIPVDSGCGLMAITYSNRYAAYVTNFRGQLIPVGDGVGDSRDVLDLETGEVRKDIGSKSVTWLAGMAIGKSRMLLSDGAAWLSFFDGHSGKDADDSLLGPNEAALTSTTQRLAGWLHDATFVLGSSAADGFAATHYVPVTKK